MAADYFSSHGRLPDYTHPSVILRDALGVLTPPEKIAPFDAITKYRGMSGGQAFDPDLTRYMEEPCNVTVSRLYRGCAFVGPARTGKTFTLVDGQIIYRMICDPCSIRVTQMDALAAKRYSQEKIEPMLRHSPDLAERLIARPGTLGNIFEKRFRGEGFVEFGWRSGSQFASKDLQVTIATDYDYGDPDNVDGEGSLWALQLKRGQTFGSRAFSIAESSPRKDITDGEWSPSTLHEMPPCTGIVALYNAGTRARWYWTCPHCSHEFEARFEHLKWIEDADPETAGASVYMLCPSGNGCVIDGAERFALNRTGRWLHESRDGKRAVPLDDPDIRPASHVSYKLNGVAAAYQSWRELVSKLLAAQSEFEFTGSDASLRTVVNTDMGDPYYPRGMSSSLELSPQRLIDRADIRPLGSIPQQARFVTISVDVQGNRFVAQADAWGEGLERWLVDRWDIAQPPMDAPDAVDAEGRLRRSIVPYLYREDWQVLADLHQRVFPAIDSDGNECGWGLTPMAVIIDSQGVPGTYDKALYFYRQRRREKLDTVYHLYKGEGRPDAPRAVRKKPEAIGKKKRDRRFEPELVFVNTNKIKDEVVSSLARDAAGPLSYHLPSSLQRNHVEEFCAERREDKGWVKKSGHLRNESLDLAVFGKAVVIVKGAESIRDWSRPPSWAAAGMDNANAVSTAKPGADPTRSDVGIMAVRKATTSGQPDLSTLAKLSGKGRKR